MKTIEKSIYETIGGKAAVDLVVPAFYKKVLADPIVN